MTRPPGTLRGVLWMAFAGVLFVGLTAVIKHVGPGVPAAQSAFLRFALGLPAAIPMLWPLLRLGLTRRQLGLFAGRGALHAAGVVLWFFAMTRIPLAEVSALGYLNPIWVTLGAALLLGERLRTGRLLAIGAALLGALVVLRPGLRAVETGHLAMLGTSALFAGGYLIAKRLSGELPAGVIVGMLSATVTAGLLPLAWLAWVPVTGAQVAWLALAAAFATGGHYAMTRAFAAAPISATQPATFLQLLYATAVGAALFGEAVDPWVVAGGAVIVLAVLAATWGEARLSRPPEEPA